MEIKQFRSLILVYKNTKDDKMTTFWNSSDAVLDKFAVVSYIQGKCHAAGKCQSLQLCQIETPSILLSSGLLSPCTQKYPEAGGGTVGKQKARL